LPQPAVEPQIASSVRSSTTDPTVDHVEVREVGFNSTAPQRSVLSELDMLRIQSAAFEQVIRKLQDELARREQAEAETHRTVESLRQEVRELRQQLNQKAPDAAAQ